MSIWRVALAGCFLVLDRVSTFEILHCQHKALNRIAFKFQAVCKSNSWSWPIRATFLRTSAIGNSEHSIPDPKSSDGNIVAINFRNQTINCREGELLRTALLRNGMTPHNGRARIINCRGLGTCGTCAIEVKGLVSPPERTALERTRLSLPPFTKAAVGHLRLACQLRVSQQCDGAPLEVTKYDGFWGQHAPRISSDMDFEMPFGELEFVLDRNRPDSTVDEK